jgi:hypothetical protein
MTLLARPDRAVFGTPSAHAVARLAAASGREEYLALAREHARTSVAVADEAKAAMLLDALAFYGAEIPVAWLEGTLSQPDLWPGRVEWLLRLLHGDPSPEARAALARLARNPSLTAAPGALSRLRAARDREVVLAVLATAATADVAAWPPAYRTSLVDACAWFKLREAVPFLLTQYQGDLEKEAAGALDTIRAYHERLATFQSWAKDMAEGRRDLSQLLADPDPEIRRAAVLSLGALGDRDALPALVRIAKEEKDAKVRQAALEAVERIARTPPPAPKSE